MIDIHAHFGNLERYGENFVPITPEQLVDWCNRQGIDQAVVLALESPEAATDYTLSDDVLEAWRRFPERLIPFVAVDPRASQRVAKLKFFAEQGAKGFGEHKCGLAIDDARSVELYRLAGELGLPVLFHMDPEINWDEPGLPHLQKVLQELPDTILIGHGPGWWSQISATDERGGYPEGPITPGGAVDRLLSEYPNIYGDLSAGSGYNAITRDPEFAEGFFERHWRKLLLGTDYLRANQQSPIIEFLRNYGLSEEQYHAITDGNARGLIRL